MIRRGQIESLDANAPLTVEEVRKRLDARKPEHRCMPRCKGWEVIDSNAHGLMVQRCDECFMEMHEDHQRGQDPNIYDSDIAQLPEAMDALAIARAEADTKPQRLVFSIEIVTDVGFQAIEGVIRRALDSTEAFTYDILGCVEHELRGDLAGRKKASRG